METGFIKNTDLLEETHQVDDLLDYSNVIEDFKKTLDKIKSNSILGLIGKFGSGKSTMLYQLYKDKDPKSKEKWINFDAWKYPERRDLWEGFVLDFSKSIKPRVFEETRKKIDGAQNDDKKTLFRTIGSIPGFAAIENLNHFFDTSPARRVFEIQDILKNIIKDLNKDIYIVVEDVDRSGDRGTFFLETLRNFIKTNNFDNKIIVIVPIGTEVFECSKVSYCKSLDYEYEFKPNKIIFDNLLRTVLKDEYAGQNHLIEQIDFLFRKALEGKELSVRDLKKMIRMANIEFKNDQFSGIDLRVFLYFSFVRQMKEKVTVNFNETIRITKEKFGYDYLIWIANSDKINNNLNSFVSVGLPIVLTKNETRNTPVFVDTFSMFMRDESFKNCYALSDKYLEFN